MVSIIVPVYNAEKYLDCCLESIVNQTYPKLQIILIDDGSTDGSFHIIQKWINRDNRILAVREENSGQGIARNRGLDLATGQYIMFVDADDWLEPDCVSCLRKSIEENRTDIVIGLISKTSLDDNSESTILKEYDGEMLSGDKLIETIFQITTYVHSRLIKKEIFDVNNIRFPNHYFEDIAIMPLIYASASSIFFIRKVVYHYRNNSGSTVNSINKIDDRIRCIDTLLNEFRNRGIYNTYESQLKEYIVERCQINLRCVKGLANRVYVTFEDKQNNYVNKLGMNSWKLPKLYTFGSYNLMIVAKIFMQVADTETLPDYYGGESVISCMGESNTELLETNIHHKNSFRETCIFYDFEKTFTHLNPGRFKDVDYILVDFLDERFDIGKTTKGEFFTLSDYFKDIKDTVDLQYTVIESFSDEWFELWKESFERFICQLSKYVDLNKVIFIKSKLACTYYDDDGNYPFENRFQIEKINCNLEKCYQIAEQRSPESIFFDVLELDSYRTNKAFRHGCFPWHLNDGAYLDMSKMIKRNLYLLGAKNNGTDKNIEDRA